MKDIVSFETAVRLKEAGFPQPKPDFGQVWHNPDFGLFVVVGKWFADNREYKIFYPGTGRSVLKSEARFLECAFAPTATDILREMADYELLSAATSDLQQFIETITDPEALAEDWLTLNEKK